MLFDNLVNIPVTRVKSEQIKPIITNRQSERKGTRKEQLYIILLGSHFCSINCFKLMAANWKIHHRLLSDDSCKKKKNYLLIKINQVPKLVLFFCFIPLSRTI